jgi:hypothetical protein
MIAWFDIPGTPRPVKFKFANKILVVHQDVKITEEKLDGNRMKIYQCQSEIDGEL